MSVLDRLALWNARYVQKPVMALNLPAPVLRALFAGAIRASNFVPRGVTITRTTLGGVPCRKIVPQGAGSGRLLYLHGGGFVIGGPITYLPLAAKLAKAAGVTVWLPDYRLAPEHPFPAAPDDALACYRALAAEGPVAVGGDSAGGCLALGLLHRDIAPPAALVLLSPATDLRAETEAALLAGPEDALLAKGWARRAVQAYIGGADRNDPVLSPMAAPFPAAPPTLVHLASDEALRPQIEAAIDALRAAGAEVTVTRFDGTFHAFQIAGLPLANRAIAEIGQYLRARLA